MRKQNIKTTIPLNVVPERRTKRFPPWVAFVSQRELKMGNLGQTAKGGPFAKFSNLNEQKWPKCKGGTLRKNLQIGHFLGQSLEG